LLDTSLTVLSILKDKPVSLKSLCEHSDTGVRAALILIINNNANLLADYKRPKPEVVPFIVDLIVDRYSYLSIDDAKLCIQNLCTGLYGEIIALDVERYGKALATYSKEKQEAAISYAGQTSNQFPKKDYKPCKMPQEVRDILKKKIGYDPKAKEKKAAYKQDWRTKMPGLDETTYQIWDWFDEQWYKQGCPLLPGSKDITAIIEYNEKNYTRGEFTHMAKKLLNGTEHLETIK
jgi:hypothetical protein